MPSHANRWLLTAVLRNEWGFKGVTVSDYTAVNELVTRHRVAATPKDAAVGHGAAVGLLPSSLWNNPEPEIATWRNAACWPHPSESARHPCL
jgi:beta-glucosidase-like glycosyl hydrolase